MRLWNLLPANLGELVVLQDTGSSGSEPNVLLGAEPLNVYAGYSPLKPGRYALKIARAADPKTVIKTFDLILRADVFVTFFARQTHDKIDIDMLDDTYDRAAALTGKVVIRQMIPDTMVTVKSAAMAAPVTLGYGEERAVDNIPLKSIAFQMQATGKNQAKGWSSEIDFKTNKHSSLWLINDVYGRFRPRTAADGQTDDEPPAQ